MMKSFVQAGAIAGVLALAACNISDSPTPAAPSADAGVAPVLATADAVDPHTHARPLEARVIHVALDLAVDFDARRVGGTATLDIRRKADAKEIVLDDNGLEIESIADQAGKPLDYKVGPRDPNDGSALAISLRPDTSRLVIKYKSAPDSDSLQWLTPQQTAGKKYPFLFSQGESIFNRSWIPTQDSPGIRQSWEARITVAKPLTAVMSAPSAEAPVDNGDTRTFSFRMEHPVAPYLIAIAVGDIVHRDLGKRTGVWAERPVIDKAAAELSDTEKMVEAAEALYGPYRWGRYDMIVLPPSFPYGGMENPTLTFLTPTFIAGDKSLVSLIAHELAHSWSGNLATNATWNDFWLNEGMTTYAERRIVESLYGKKVADEQVALGVDALNKAIAENGGPGGADTRLHLDLKGRHPDDGLTDIAYEKGAAFLRTIESVVGRDRFDAWLKGWFERHSFQPVTSAMFLADIRANLVKGDPELEKKLMLEQWIYQPGIPSNMVRPAASVFAEQDKAVADFAAGGPAPQNWASWTTDERLRFLTRLPRKLDRARLDALQAAFDLNRTGNMEIRFAWLDLAVANRYDPAVASLEQFLGSVGRGKFVRPLYTALSKDRAWGLPIAKRVYAANRGSYHPQVQDAVDKLKIGS
jgi:leukotriene-A4 hydrolase